MEVEATMTGAGVFEPGGLVAHALDDPLLAVAQGIALLTGLVPEMLVDVLPRLLARRTLQSYAQALKLSLEPGALWRYSPH
ncbi:hypothetical protein D3C85_1161860 [compost metagenome]